MSIENRIPPELTPHVVDPQDNVIAADVMNDATVNGFRQDVAPLNRVAEQEVQDALQPKERRTEDGKKIVTIIETGPRFAVALTIFESRPPKMQDFNDFPRAERREYVPASVEETQQ